jgi:ATP-dependent DNA helicase Q4
MMNELTFFSKFQTQLSRRRHRHNSSRHDMSTLDALSREIVEWQNAFTASTGRRPERRDVEADACVREKFRMLKRLKEAQDASTTTTDAATTPTRGNRARGRHQPLTHAEIKSRMAAREKESDEDDDDAIEATPIKPERPRTDANATPRRSPRIAARTMTTTPTVLAATTKTNVVSGNGEVGKKPRVVRPLMQTTTNDVDLVFKSRVGVGAKNGGFAALKRVREKAIGEEGKMEALLCEATVAAMRGAAQAPKKQAMDLTVSSMLADDDAKKRKRKVVAASDPIDAVASTSGRNAAETTTGNGEGLAVTKAAAEFRAEHAAKAAAAERARKAGNFKKTNLKGKWKQRVKNGARKKAAAHYRYGGGRRSKYKAEDAADPDEEVEAPSIWASGDWCEPPSAKALAEAKDDLTPTKRALRAREAADGMAREYITAAAAESAKVEAERRARLEVGPEMQAAIERASKEPNETNLLEVLNRGFGHEQFRPGQLEIVERVMREENTLALLPTGAGKSLTYQLPALLLPGLTLVVSPLLALMADQMDSLPPSLPGGALRSDMNRADMWDTLTRLRNGEIKVLFVSPERLLNDNFVGDLQNVPGGVSLAVIDEAHCVSEWSHNFRPAYHRLGRILADRVRAKTTLALTATATKKTELSLIKQLGIAQDGVLRNVRVRDNLILSVMRVPALAREKTLLHLLKYDEMLQTGSVIVYTATQRDSERVAGYLYNEGIKAKAYHAGQEPAQRRQTQHEFMMSKVRVVIATIAFGMGLDKSDVRAVINFSLPRSPEAYIQQAGRAGRDGAPAACITFLDPEDYLRSRSLTFSDGVDRPSITKLLQHVLQSGPVVKKAKDEVEWTPCVGALAANEMEIKLDMRIEAIETVLSCLDLWGEGLIDIRSKDPSVVNELDPAHAKGLIRILPDLRATCEAQFYGRTPEEIGKDCPLAAAIAKLVPKPKGSMYKFKIVDACMHMQSGFDNVAAQLKVMSKHDDMTYTTSDRAVGFEIIRPPPRDIIPLAKALADHCRDIEACSVGKLDTLYNAMEQAADAENEEAQGEHLRACLEEYLNEDTNLLPSPPICVKHEARLLVADIKTLLQHRSGGKTGGAGMMSARAVARILHKLHSPAYPMKEWSRNDLWGRHYDVDFAHIVEKADEAIAKSRGLVK